MKIVIKNISNVTAVTIDGNIYPIYAGRKEKISHPINLPYWIEDGINKGLTFIGDAHVEKIGITQKGNPKYKVSFRGEMVNSQDYWELTHTHYLPNNTFLKTVEVRRVYGNPLLGKERIESETVKFSSIPKEEQEKLFKYRIDRFFTKVDQRLNTVYNLVTVEDAATYINHVSGDHFNVIHFPARKVWESSYGWYDSYYKSHKTIFFGKHQYCSDPNFGGNEVNASIIYDIEKKKISERIERRRYKSDRYVAESDDQYRSGGWVTVDAEDDFLIEEFKYSFKLKEQFKGMFTINHKEIVIEKADLVRA